MTMIPHIVHQTWRNHIISPPFRPEWPDSWRTIMGSDGWQYRLWTDSDLASFVTSEYPDFRDFYFSYDHHIQRVDAARYLILARLGGLFVDLDMICLRTLAPILHDTSLLFGLQYPTRSGIIEALSIGDNVCNAVMASSPSHPFWRGIDYDLVAASRAHSDVISTTGPAFLTQRVRDSLRFLEHETLPTLLNSEAFFPIPWYDSRSQQLRTASITTLRRQFPNSYAASVWTASWL